MTATLAAGVIAITPSSAALLPTVRAHLESGLNEGRFTNPVIVRTRSGWSVAWGEEGQLAVAQASTVGHFLRPIHLKVTLPDGRPAMASGTGYIPGGAYDTNGGIAGIETASGEPLVAWMVTPGLTPAAEQWVVVTERAPNGDWTAPKAIAGPFPCCVKALRMSRAPGGAVVLSIDRWTQRFQTRPALTLERERGSWHLEASIRGVVYGSARGPVSVWQKGANVFLARRGDSGWTAPTRIGSGKIEPRSLATACTWTARA